MACQYSFSFSEDLKLFKQKMQSQAKQRRISSTYGESTITSLPRGGLIVKTKIGSIQFGLPPETVKDSLKLGLDVPTFFIIPSVRFDRKTGINVSEFEFPAYFNFFCNKRKICLICTKQAEADIRDIFQETLIGPLDHKNLSEDFYHKFPANAYPNFIKERKVFSSNPLNPSEDLKIDTLLSFKVFNEETQSVIIQEKNSTIEIIKKVGYFDIKQDGYIVASIADEVVLGDSQNNGDLFARLQSQSSCCSFNSDLSPPKKKENFSFRVPEPSTPRAIKQISQINKTFFPPDFGVTILGSSHGFDPNGSTSGFILWIYGRGIMIDPPTFSNDYMKSLGINFQLINGIIISHCHADHDAGAFHSILADQKIEVITTRTIMNSFLRKYSAVSQISQDELKRLFVFRPVIIGTSMKIFGASFSFFYSFHTIPSLGFEVEVNSKHFYFSSDTFYSPKDTIKYCQEGKISQQRCDQLSKINFEKYDLILHEAGVPPIHTPQKVLAELPDSVKKKMYLIHIAEKDLLKDSGLRIPQVGFDSTIIIEQKVNLPELQLLKRLDVISKIDLFEHLSIKHAKHLMDAVNVEEYKSGEIIFHEGDQGYKFYIIQSGIVRISSFVTNLIDKLFQLGDYFGEISLIDENCRRVATAEAIVDCSLLTLEKHDFNFLFGGQLGKGVIYQKLMQLSNARQKLAIAAIESNSILSELEQSQKTQLEMIMTEVSYEKSEIIWKQDASINFSLIIKEGEVSLFKSNKNTKLNDEDIKMASSMRFSYENTSNEEESDNDEIDDSGSNGNLSEKANNMKDKSINKSLDLKVKKTNSSLKSLEMIQVSQEFAQVPSLPQNEGIKSSYFKTEAQNEKDDSEESLENEQEKNLLPAPLKISFSQVFSDSPEEDEVIKDSKMKQIPLNIQKKTKVISPSNNQIKSFSDHFPSQPQQQEKQDDDCHSFVILRTGAFIGDTKSIYFSKNKSINHLVARTKVKVFQILNEDLLKFLSQNPGLKLIFEQNEYFE